VCVCVCVCVCVRACEMLPILLIGSFPAFPSSCNISSKVAFRGAWLFLCTYRSFPAAHSRRRVHCLLPPLQASNAHKGDAKKDPAQSGFAQVSQDLRSMWMRVCDVRVHAALQRWAREGFAVDV